MRATITPAAAPNHGNAFLKTGAFNALLLVKFELPIILVLLVAI
jgi:hypothetical protein